MIGLNNSKFSKYLNGLEVSINDIVAPSLNKRAKCRVEEINSNSMILTTVENGVYIPSDYFKDNVNWIIVG